MIFPQTSIYTHEKLGPENSWSSFVENINLSNNIN